MDKYYHSNIYNLEVSKNFNEKKARKLAPKEKSEYIKTLVPREKVIEFQIENVKSLTN